MRKEFLALAALAVVGCAPVEQSPSGPIMADACGANAHRGMIGTPIAAATFPAGVRTIGPETIVTEDYVPARLNVLIDARGVITGFRCG